MIFRQAKQTRKTRQFWTLGEAIEKVELGKNKTLEYQLQKQHSRRDRVQQSTTAIALYLASIKVYYKILRKSFGSVKG